MGTYPAAGPEAPAGAGEGVWLVELDTATGGLGGHLAATLPAPSFLAATPDGRGLLAVGETGPGSVSLLDVGPGGTLALTETVASGGVHPCHLTVHPDGHAVYVANYSSGSLAVVPLAVDGTGRWRFVGGVAQVFEHSGRGPVEDRQGGPHVHASLLTPDGRLLLAADLGTDELRGYAVGPDGALTPLGVVHRFPPGTGPRHLAWLPGGDLVVVGELDVTVHVLRRHGEAFVEVEVLPAGLGGLVGGEHVYPAHPVVVGSHLLVSVRGSDLLARYAWADGRLTHLDDTRVGTWPRHLAVVPDDVVPGGAVPGDDVPGDDDRPGWAVVAAQGAGRLESYRLAGEGARVSGPVGVLEVPTPACVVAAPR